jgi:hypothetical protein
LLLSACAGPRLQPGLAQLDDIEKSLGPPAMRWQAPDGSQQLAYPRGPMGFRTDMVYVGADGRVQRIENALSEKNFAAIRAGMTQADVLRVLGPSDPAQTVYFEARDELVWDWRFCNAWNEAARFYVLFDGRSGRVRSTMSQSELLLSNRRDRSMFCSQSQGFSR